jgi:hypothetical protein
MLGGPHTEYTALDGHAYAAVIRNCIARLAAGCARLELREGSGDTTREIGLFEIWCNSAPEPYLKLVI